MLSNKSMNVSPKILFFMKSPIKPAMPDEIKTILHPFNN